MLVISKVESSIVVERILIIGHRTPSKDERPCDRDATATATAAIELASKVIEIEGVPVVVWHAADRPSLLDKQLESIAGIPSGEGHTST